MFSQIIQAYETVTSKRRVRDEPALRQDIDRWCQAELAPWRVERAGEGAALFALNRSNPWIVLFVINSFGVRRVAKPRDCAPNPAAEIRANYYHSIFRTVARRMTWPRDIMMAVDVNDEPMQAGGWPVFSFQKPRGSRNILLPDVDFFQTAESSLPRWPTTDWRRWRGKLHRAIFVGSTTGGRITPDSLRTQPVPRVRSAAAFRDTPDVDFHLARLAGCESREAEDMLRAMGHGKGAVSWAKQLQYRFILSMDGNGATCSRLPIILRSHSVLLKYASDHTLYYFRALKPWVHYVPIKADADVLAVIGDARVYPERYRAIAKAGRAFRRRYLTQWMVGFYIERLMGLYLQREAAPVGGRELIPASARPLELV